MIVYEKTKEDFSNDVLTNDIDNIISDAIRRKTGHGVSRQEMRAFQSSLGYMYRVLMDPDIPNGAGISIEYNIPQTAKRVDFIITGTDEKGAEKVVLVELKQWTSCETTDRDGIVKTMLGGTVRDTSHPSYQVYSYTALLNGFNATIEEDNIQLIPCAYLHNYVPDGNITDSFYKFYVDRAPVFLKPDAVKLQNFIKRFIKRGDSNNVMFRIDNGRIRPTKSLADVLNSLLKGNKEFVMIDDQKVVYETIKKIAGKSSVTNKNVVIVEGGAGTGKTVIAINLLVDLVKKGNLAQYVTKTSAPRDVYFEKLKGKYKLIALKKLFTGSGTYMNAPKNSVNILLVDEAHRLTQKTGFLKRGDDQIKEIINTSLCSVFFIDEGQRVHVNDYGEIDVIENIAEQLGAEVHKMELQSQFRCNGSDGYIAWLDQMLQIRQTANYNYNREAFGFDFRVVDTAQELRDLIFEKNEERNKARMVAGYCWPWVSKKDPHKFDFTSDEFGFNMRWNMTEYGGKWIIAPDSVTEIGCIHTAQGLEVDYIGVIVGDDLVVRDGEVRVDPAKRAHEDRTISGWRAGIKQDPARWNPLLKTIVKNTYKTLMTRGMKGCYVYFTDEETAKYFREHMDE